MEVETIKPEREVVFPPSSTLNELKDWFEARKIKEITRIIFWMDNAIVRYR